MPQKLTNDIITAAISGFEAQKQRIDSQIAELRGLLNGNSPATETETSSKPKRKVSAAARRRMAQAQKKRWAAIKGQSQSKAQTPAAPKRRISEEGLKRIIAATKKRWALKRAEDAKANRAAAKKSSPAQKKAA